jgi:hypothetical protein
MNDVYARQNLRIFRDNIYLTVFFNVFDVVDQITKIQRMWVMNCGQFFFMNKNSGIGAFVIVFTMVVVKMGMV